METKFMFTRGNRQMKSGKPFDPTTALRRAILAGTLTALTLTAAGVSAGDTDSTPLQTPVSDQERAAIASAETTTTISSQAQAAFSASFAQKVTIGLNQEISRRGSANGSTFIPPDTMGAVGPNHIVETINGNFEIFDKMTGASLDNRSLDSFWNTTVGLAGIQNFSFDPRVVFDPGSGRWFVVSIDSSDTDGDGVRDAANNVYIARTDTDDPTGDWDGVSFAADTVGGPDFHDYPTLALDADGVYICTQDFSIPPGNTDESCYSIPKADLLAAVPTVANMTRFEATPAGLPTVDGSIQVALDFGLTDGRAPLLGTSGGALRRSDIFGAQTPTATLGAIVPVIGDPGSRDPSRGAPAESGRHTADSR